jgi:hypothetical protein
MRPYESGSKMLEEIGKWQKEIFVIIFLNLIKK